MLLGLPYIQMLLLLNPASSLTFPQVQIPKELSNTFCTHQTVSASAFGRRQAAIVCFLRIPFYKREREKIWFSLNNFFLRYDLYAVKFRDRMCTVWPVLTNSYTHVTHITIKTQNISIEQESFLLPLPKHFPHLCQKQPLIWFQSL